MDLFRKIINKNMLKAIINVTLTACKRYCLAAGATQGNIAHMQTVRGKFDINHLT
jgi:hypothetical protein